MRKVSYCQTSANHPMATEEAPLRLPFSKEAREIDIFRSACPRPGLQIDP